jgi:streptogramin lyase
MRSRLLVSNGSDGGARILQRHGAKVDRSMRPGLELLESRRLLALGFNEFPIPTAESDATWITGNPNGNLYFVETGANQIGQLNPSTFALIEHPIPTAGSKPTSITSGANGALYFTAPGTNQIGQFDPASLAFTVFPIPTAGSGAQSITTGTNSDLYFTESDANQIGQLNPSSHVFAAFPIPTASSGSSGITTGANGDLYFTETAADQIGQFNPGTHVFAEFPIPTAASGAINIAAGADGNLYFVEAAANQIGQFNPSTHAFVEYPIPTADSGATNIAAGSNGNLYFTETAASQIGQFSPTTHAFLELPTPTSTSGPTGITNGPDGNIYFTETAANQVGRLLIVTQTLKSTTTQLAVAPNPSVVGQAVTLTATVTSAKGGTPTGTVTFFVDGTPQPPVKIVVQHGVARAVLSTKLADATHIITARYKGNSQFAASVSSAVSLVVFPAPGDGPTVVHLVRLGFHAAPTTLVLTFDKALDPATAQDPRNYRLTQLNGRSIRIGSIVYDPSTFMVTLSPTRRLNLHQSYRLTVIGTPPTGVTDTSGILLDGALTGHPGSNFVTLVTALDLRITAKPKTLARGRR